MFARLSSTLWVGFIRLLALGLFGISLGINYMSAATIWTDDASGLTGMLWPAASTSMDAVKFAGIAVLASQWRRGARFMPGIASIVVLLSGISIAATMMLNLEQQSVSAGRVVAAKLRLTDLRAQGDRVQIELNTYAEYPAASVVRRQMEAMEHDRRWTSSEGCSNATIAASRRFCAAYKAAFSRLAGATRADELRAQIAKLNDQILQATTTDALTVHRAGFAIVADWLNVDHRSVSLTAAFVLAFALELAGLTAWSLVPSSSVRSSDTLTDGAAHSHQDQADVREVMKTAKQARSRNASGKSPERISPSAATRGTNVTPLRRQAPDQGSPPGPNTTGQSINSAARTDGNAALALTSALNPSAEVFAAHGLKTKQGARVQAQLLQTAYVDWCRAQGLGPISQVKLAQGLKALGIRKTRGGRNGSHVYHDVALR